MGAAISALGGLSLIWTTPAIEILERWTATIGATPADVSLLVLTSAALGAGAVIRRRTQWSSRLTFGPGLAVGGLWLISVAAGRSTLWALPLGLILSAGVLIGGATHRLAAPMVLGAGIVIAMVLTSYRSYLGQVPLWVWFGLGGVILMGVGVGIERASRRGRTLADLGCSVCKRS